MYAADFSLLLATDKHWMALSHSLPQSMAVRFLPHAVDTGWGQRGHEGCGANMTIDTLLSSKKGTDVVRAR